MKLTQKKKILLIFLPFILIASTAVMFRITSETLGKDLGTLLGFLFYQIVWCIIIPSSLLGRKRFFGLFKEKESFLKVKNTVFILLLALTVIGSLVAFLPSNIKLYAIEIFLIGIPLTTFNAFCEEIFWRGMFIEFFKKNIFLAIIYPSILFALWHISPQLVNPDISLSQISVIVLMALPLGLIYGVVAFRNGSIKWVSITHSIIGILAFGVPLSTSVANLIGL